MARGQQRFYYLDGLRGLAALVITVSHFSDKAFGHALLDRIYLAVDFFFVLAGFVSCYAYEQRLLTDMSWWEFAKRRLIRLYPLYFIGFLGGLAITAALNWHTVIGLHYLVTPSLAHLAMLPTVYEGSFPGITYLGPFKGEAFPLNLAVWALAYEVFVSLLYAALVKRLPDKVLTIVVAGLFVALGLSVAIAGGYSAGSQVAHIPAGVLRTAFSFFMGVLVFRLWQRRDAPKVSWLTLTLCFYALLSLHRLGSGNRFLDAGILLFVMPTLVYLAASCDVPKALEGICKISGDLAYPIYMVHYPFVRFAGLFVQTHHLGVRATAGVFVVTYAAILGLSVLALKYFDKPVRRWLNGMAFPRPAGSRAAA